jgi:hypothetical protein
MSQRRFLYKMPQGLGYADNVNPNPLQSQAHIQPQPALLKTVTPQQMHAFAKSRAAMQHPVQGNSFKRFPVTQTSCYPPCDKTAGIL